ncbi:MAG: hypothetical protein GWP91_21475 [Rhodobacterales bacterium]|nr:hypothetical protein [Rhodobacterales bacterium]
MTRAALAMALLIGCGGNKDDENTDTAAADVEEVFQGAPLAELSDGACPKLENPGERSFSSNGVERDVIIRFPASKPANMPVMFYWHGLGDSASNMDRALSAQDLADEHQAVIVIPYSTDPFLITWDFISNGGDDVVPFDDMRTCLSQELDVDLNRISTAGFSFGALWSTFLALERADTLSAVVSMSGGTDASLGMPYVTPASQVPVLVMWGGSADIFDMSVFVVDFEANSANFSSGLQNDGHFVVECDHGLGHTVPADFMDIMVPFAFDHTYGKSSPFASGISGFPSYCSIAG